MRKPDGTEQLSDPFNISCGVLQGDIFSPVAFIAGLWQISTLPDLLTAGISVNRSRVVRNTKPTDTVSTQRELSPSIDRPILKAKANQKHATEIIKTTCAKVSSSAGVSVETARLVVKIVAKELYGHEFYMSLEEQNNATLEIGEEMYVLPSARTISDYKYLLASQSEVNAVAAIYNK